MFNSYHRREHQGWRSVNLPNPALLGSVRKNVPVTFPPAPPPPGQPQSVLPVGDSRTEGTAVAALVCAILSWVLVPIVLAVVALVLARSAEKAIDASPTELTGRGMVTAARWVAWVHLILVAMVVAFLSAFAIAVWIGR